MMIVKGITDEDFVNYKLPSMFIASPTCTFKCEKEAWSSCCQNSSLAAAKEYDVNPDVVIKRYLRNPITKAICFGGLEPFDRIFDVLEFVSALRIKFKCDDPVVIYTGYYPHEIELSLQRLAKYKNIIVKFGRYVPGEEPHYDEVLGVMLASSNQYAEVIS